MADLSRDVSVQRSADAGAIGALHLVHGVQRGQCSSLGLLSPERSQLPQYLRYSRGSLTRSAASREAPRVSAPLAQADRRAMPVWLAGAAPSGPRCELSNRFDLRQGFGAGLRA